MGSPDAPTTPSTMPDSRRMNPIHVGICAVGSRLAFARVLAESIRGLRPDWPITVLVIPGEHPLELRDGEPFEPLHLDYLDDAALVRSLHATTYEKQDRLAGPALVERLLRAGAGQVLYLSPESLMLTAPVELERALEAYDAVVVPRLRGVLPDDGERPDATDLGVQGDLDDGMFAVRNTAEGRRVAEWWADQARAATVAISAVESAGADPPERVAATPLLSAVRSFAGVGVLDALGYGVSAWNLHERPLARAEDGSLTAGGEVVSILRLPTFRPDRPWWLADFATRSPVLDDPVLEPLCADYASRVRDAGWGIADDGPEHPIRNLLGNGLRYDRRLRRLHHKAVVAGEDFGDIFTPAGAEAFTAWLTEPGPVGAAQGINRYVHGAWLGRPDLPVAYPDLDDPAHAEGFIGWTWVHGREELGLQEPLLPPRPPWIERTRSDPPSVLVSGYLRGVVGLGEAARANVRALETAGVPVATNVLPTDTDTGGAARQRLRADSVEFAERFLPVGAVPEIHLCCANADQTPGVLAELPGVDVPGYTIGLWAWETDTVPPRWDPVFKLVDEIWVYTTWIAETIARVSPVPVVVMPPPVPIPEASPGHPPVEVPDAFRFLFAFDFYSTMTRKNPVGLVNAFTRAFQPGEGPVLVLKSINGHLRPDERARVQHAARDRSDVVILDGVLSPREQTALFAACDCYVSLHRAEGFGMTLAEAMALGKPVIATAWSGNMDFTTVHNAYLVDYQPRAVGPDNPPYNPEGTWAEPSIDHAAELMRHVWEHQDEARARGARAQADVRLLLSPEAVGARARARLERIAALRRTGHDGGSLAEASRSVTADAEAALGYDPGAHVGPGARGRTKRALLHLMRPYTVPQRKLDAEMVRALSGIAATVEWLRENRVRDQLRLRELERRISEEQ
jgi:glycosyltransferase involved in cell wall biosynthesis